MAQEALVLLGHEQMLRDNVSRSHPIMGKKGLVWERNTDFVDWQHGHDLLSPTPAFQAESPPMNKQGAPLTAHLQLTASSPGVSSGYGSSQPGASLFPDTQAISSRLLLA